MHCRHWTLYSLRYRQRHEVKKQIICI
jgi:hypothetical protein